MTVDLFFLISSRIVTVKYVLFGKYEGGYRIYAKDSDGQTLWHYDRIRDHLDDILPELAELIGDDSTWTENDTGKPVTAWNALLRLSEA